VGLLLCARRTGDIDRAPEQRRVQQQIMRAVSRSRLTLEAEDMSFIFVSIYLFAHVFIYLSIYLCIYLFVIYCIFIYLFIYLSIFFPLFSSLL